MFALGQKQIFVMHTRTSAWVNSGQEKAHNAGGRYRPYCSVSVVAPRGANASCPANTPAGLALGGSCHADTSNPCHARSASVGGLRDDVRPVTGIACADTVMPKAKTEKAINRVMRFAHMFFSNQT